MDYDITFIEAECKHQHWASAKAPSEWARIRGATHTLQTQDGDRPARILKTVAYIGVDESDDGLIVWQKWRIRQLWTIND